jgi:hypothetical protein
MRLYYCFFFRLLTRNMQTQDLTFASVHDSYWTHASSIDKMSEIIRDTFIALHSSDVLDKLQFEVSLPLFHPIAFTSAIAHMTASSLVPATVCGL